MAGGPARAGCQNSACFQEHFLRARVQLCYFCRLVQQPSRTGARVAVPRWECRLQPDPQAQLLDFSGWTGRRVRGAGVRCGRDRHGFRDCRRLAGAAVRGPGSAAARRGVRALRKARRRLRAHRAGRGLADGGSRRSAEDLALRNGSAQRAGVHRRAACGAARRARTTGAGAAPRRGNARAVCRRAAKETADLIRGTYNMRGTKVVAALAGLAGLAMSASARAAPWYFQTPASQLARDIDWLHQLVMWLILVIFVGVFGAMFYACWAHRKSRGHQAEQFHENTMVEIIWTVIPAIILVVIACPVTKVVIAQKDTSAADITIKATGYQWKWGYDYIKGEGEGISFLSTLITPRAQIEGKEPKGPNYLLEVDNELVVPVGKKVRIITTAADVVHSWWIPAFGAKQDAIPGFLRDTWFRADTIGTYHGQCVELCGKEHGFMPIVVQVVSADDYTKWVAQYKQKAEKAAAGDTRNLSMQELMQRGEKFYQDTCVACHGAKGEGNPGIKAPALAGSKIATGPKEGHIDIVLQGKANTAMQSFKALGDADLAAVMTYERNSWGNKGGEVQPAEVAARRK